MLPSSLGTFLHATNSLAFLLYKKKLRILLQSLPPVALNADRPTSCRCMYVCTTAMCVWLVRTWAGKVDNIQTRKLRSACTPKRESKTISEIGAVKTEERGQT